MSMTINYYSKGERDGILDRLNAIGCIWNSGHKANDLSWNGGLDGNIEDDEGSITVTRSRLTCGDTRDNGICAKQFLELPINYCLLVEENNA